MSWKSLSDIDTTDLASLNEYMSRPDERVLELTASKPDQEIVIYGATGKWMMDITEMMLRAIRETGTTGRKVHLVARFSRERETLERLEPYRGLYRIHKVDFLNLMMGDLTGLEAAGAWVIYGIGYKFRTTETEQEYERLCNVYGKVIPSLIFTYHKRSSDIVMIGSGNPLPPSPIDSQAPDDAVLQPMPGQVYGESIRNKEEILKIIIEDEDPRSSKGVILRAMYMTNFTYGGLEEPVLRVMRGQPVDLGKVSAFNIISHRDASIYAILAVEAASNPVTNLNLSGHTVTTRRVAAEAAHEFGLEPVFTGRESKLHLLADDSKIRRLFGPPVDGLDEMLAAQIHWISNSGQSLKIDHKVGRAI